MSEVVVWRAECERCRVGVTSSEEGVRTWISAHLAGATYDDALGHAGCIRTETIEAPADVDPGPAGQDLTR